MKNLLPGICPRVHISIRFSIIQKTKIRRGTVHLTSAPTAIAKGISHTNPIKRKMNATIAPIRGHIFATTFINSIQPPNDNKGKKIIINHRLKVSTLGGFFCQSSSNSIKTNNGEKNISRKTSLCCNHN